MKSNSSPLKNDGWKVTNFDSHVFLVHLFSMPMTLRLASARDATVRRTFLNGPILRVGCWVHYLQEVDSMDLNGVGLFAYMLGGSSHLVSG